jgi:hypothetical protein
MEQRSEFRIVYPLPARPVATVGGRRFTTLDVSERALRLDLRRVEPPLVAGERIAGSVRLALRVDGLAAVVLIDDPFRIDTSVIFQEQRYLRSRFPNWR